MSNNINVLALVKGEENTFSFLMMKIEKPRSDNLVGMRQILI